MSSTQNKRITVHCDMENFFQTYGVAYFLRVFFFLIEGGCNMELARMCFLGLSNGTLTAMVSKNKEKRKHACE